MNNKKIYKYIFVALVVVIISFVLMKTDIKIPTLQEENKNWRDNYEMSQILKIYNADDLTLQKELFALTISEAIVMLENEISDNGYFESCVVQPYITEHSIKYYYHRPLTKDETILIKEIPMYICEEHKNDIEIQNILTTYEKFELESQCSEKGKQKMIKDGVPQGNNVFYSIYIYGFYSQKINKCIYVTNHTSYRNDEYNTKYTEILRFDCDGGCINDIITATEGDEYYADKLKYFDELIRMYK